MPGTSQQKPNSPLPEPPSTQPSEPPQSQQSNGDWNRIGQEMVKLLQLLQENLEANLKNLKAETPKLPWLKLFLVPITCYIPAFLLVLMSFFLFRTATTPNPASQSANPAETAKRAPDLQEGIDSLETSPLAREYIRTEIKNEVKTQVEQKTQDQGDLFGQIAFPVLFAIASIFVAFAVKDVLTEILKEQEKEKVMQDLRRVLEAQMIEAIKVLQGDLTDRMETVESYTNWLEHQLLDVIVTQTIDEIKESPNAEESKLIPVRRVLERRSITLKKVSKELGKDHFDLLKQIEDWAIEAKIKSLKLSEETENDLLALCRNSDNKAYEEYRYTRMKSIFEMQKDLCIATLRKLEKDADDSLKKDIQKWIDSIDSTIEKLKQKVKERREEIIQFNNENPDEVHIEFH